jgi:hypothetical protein
MPKPVSRFARTEQPVNWSRAFWCGIGSAMLMMAFIDIFNTLGVTDFSFEIYLGGLLATTPYPHRNWVLGFLANCVMGGLFGLFYAYFFEYVFKRANARTGVTVAIFHSVVAAVAIFPFFGVIHEYMGTGLYPRFGFFGTRMGLATTILLFVAHLLFGAMMGTFYGPVRTRRVLAREFEPGETGLPGEKGVITEDEDHPERAAV